MSTPEEMHEFLKVFTIDFRKKFGERAALVVALSVPEQGDRDAWATGWIGPCLTAKGLIHFAIPALDRTIVPTPGVTLPVPAAPVYGKIWRRDDEAGAPGRTPPL